MEAIEILRLVESYVFRRAISGVPTNSLNKIFASLMREVDKDKYLESLKTVFLRLTDNRRYPLDPEFKEKFILKDVYNFKRRNYLLRKLEEYEHKESINPDEYTVEHVMPQNPNLSDEWKNELGQNWQEVQEKYLHTIGNITLTGYNSELRDLSFTKKKERKPGGFRDSRLRLNDGLVQAKKWDEANIRARAEELAEKALKIWISPE